MHRFETSYRRHLANEQRRAVLHALRDKLEPTVTMGEVIDAAEALGYGEQLGDLSLQDLADALLTPVEKAANTAAPRPVLAEAERPAKAPVKANKPAPTKLAKPKSARLRALKKKIDADERMSIDEASELFLPVIEEMQQATMQDLESFTGIGRRKLRFHVGQLVREGLLVRHGMGRGTYYTVVG